MSRTPTVMGASAAGYDKPCSRECPAEQGAGCPSSASEEAWAHAHGASWKVPEEEWYGTQYPEALSGENRANFIRKVYGILAFQMTITLAICVVAMLVPPVQAVFVNLVATPVANIVIFIPAFGVLCALQKYKAQHPTNYYLLMAFTVLMSLNIAGTCAVYQKLGLGRLIVEAFVVTAVAFGSLSAYALKSGKDFTWMGGMLTMGLMGLIAFAFFGWVFGFSGGILFSLFGVLLFCGFVLYDTSRILAIYGPDDAIAAAVELYLDILNLFLYILQLLSECQGE